VLISDIAGRDVKAGGKTELRSTDEVPNYNCRQLTVSGSGLGKAASVHMLRPSAMSLVLGTAHGRRMLRGGFVAVPVV